MNIVDKNLALGAVRHGLQVLTGYLVTKGLITEGDTETVVGLLLGIVTFGWSVWENRKMRAVTVQVKSTP